VIAALFVERGGTYCGLPGVDPWDKERDARCYSGPWPVVAHPPCQRWGRFSDGGPSAPGTRKTGDDEGCFEAALAAVRTWGGVLEHPCDSKAWRAFGIPHPKRHAGWMLAHGGPRSGLAWTCYVEQGHYGHFARKATWLYCVGPRPPELIWTRGEQRLPVAMVERHGYQKARRIGAMAWVGGKDKTRIREATPPEFRDLLIAIARTVAPCDHGTGEAA
jgi:hypothetical protein